MEGYKTNKLINNLNYKVYLQQRNNSKLYIFLHIVHGYIIIGDIIEHMTAINLLYNIISFTKISFTKMKYLPPFLTVFILVILQKGRRRRKI